MNLCLCCCFRWRHGWFIPVWACSTKPTPWCIPLGLHFFRYCTLDFFFSPCTWSSLIRRGDICSREGELEVNNNNKGGCEDPASMFPCQHSNSQLSSWLIIWPDQQRRPDGEFLRRIACSVRFSVIDSALAWLPLNTLLLFNFRGLFPTKYRQSIKRLSYGPASVKTEGKLKTLTVFELSSFFFFLTTVGSCGGCCSLSQLHYRLVGGGSSACQVAEKNLEGVLVAGTPSERCRGTPEQGTTPQKIRFQRRHNLFQQKITEDRIFFHPFDGTSFFVL